MSRLKKVAVCGAIVALMGVFSAPAMAERFPEGPGQPMTSGLSEGGTAVIHCQVAMEFLISVGFFPPSDETYPGAILVKQHSDGPPSVRSVGPRPCPAIVFFQS